MRLRRRTLAALSPLLLAALFPSRVAADRDKDESGKGRENKREDQKRSVPPRAPQVPVRPAPQPASQAQRAAVPAQQPVQQPAAPSSTSPTSPTAAYPPPHQGTERMVSDPVQVVGADGTGAGPVRLDVEGARPGSTYEVEYVPGSGAAGSVVLGRVQTDSAGRFAGAAPEPMPGLDVPGRTGVFVFRRVP